jgi:hypothetical protein
MDAIPKAVMTAVSGRSAPSAYGTVRRTTTWATTYRAKKSAAHVTALAETSASRAIVTLASAMPASSAATASPASSRLRALTG